jgi:hypothetical protein
MRRYLLTSIPYPSRLADERDSFLGHPQKEGRLPSPINTYSAYKAEYDPVLQKELDELAAAWSQYQSCLQAAESAYGPESEKYKEAARKCSSDYGAKDRSIRAAYDPILEDIEKRARDGLAKLPRLIVSWNNQSARAKSLENVQWGQTWGGGPGTKAPILRVKSFAELRKTLEFDRWMNELLLVVAAKDTKLQLGGKTKTITEIATEVKGTVKTHVDDVAYINGQVIGAPPSDAQTLRSVLGAGRITDWWAPVKDIVDKLTYDKFCFPLSAVLTDRESGAFGNIAEQLIQQHYCRTLGCSPLTEYFDNYNPDEWRHFLLRHDPKLKGKEVLVRALLSLIGERPDIATNNGSRREYYEIKPFSPAGVGKGAEKLIAIATLMAVLDQPYIPGITYNGGEVALPGASGTVFGYSVKANLLVMRAPYAPGLVLYLMCLEGEFVEILVKWSLRLLVLFLIARMARGLPPLLPEGGGGPVPVPAPL